MTWQDLARYVNAPESDHDELEAAHAAAESLVSDLIGAREVPAAIRSRAVMEVGANLYNRRLARQGTGAWTSTDLTAAPAPQPALDPLTPAYPLLRRYLGPVIA